MALRARRGLFSLPFFKTSRLIGMNPMSMSALAIMHSLRGYEKSLIPDGDFPGPVLLASFVQVSSPKAAQYGR